MSPPYEGGEGWLGNKKMQHHKLRFQTLSAISATKPNKIFAFKYNLITFAADFVLKE
jgi:hypothetical protein